MMFCYSIGHILSYSACVPIQSILRVPKAYTATTMRRYLPPPMLKTTLLLGQIDAAAKSFLISWGQVQSACWAMITHISRDFLARAFFFLKSSRISLWTILISSSFDRVYIYQNGMKVKRADFSPFSVYVPKSMIMPL